MANLDELKTVRRSIFLQEIIAKSESCAIVWHSLAPGVYSASASDYDFQLTKTGTDTTSLDVYWNMQPFASYGSSQLTEVDDLYQVVDGIIDRMDELDRLRQADFDIGGLHSCTGNRYSETGTGGIRGGGAATVVQLRPHASSLLLPTSFDGNASSVAPWSGDFTFIDDSPDVTAHDGDGTYVRQEVSGEPPTTWPYGTIGYTLSGLGNSGPYTVRAREVYRRDPETGVDFIAQIWVNDSQIQSDTVTAGFAYNTLSSGTVAVPVNLGTMSSLAVRVMIYTNSGDTLARAIRVTAADILVTSFDIVA
jgi:hypothetical protein